MSDYFRQPNHDELLNFIAVHAKDPHAEILSFREKEKGGEAVGECDCR